MKARLTLVNVIGECVDQMEVNQDDWRKFLFQEATYNWGAIRFCDVEFEDGLKGRVQFDMWPMVGMGDRLRVNFNGVQTEEDFRTRAIELTGWEPLELPERGLILKQIAEEKRNYELCDMQWEALSEGRGGRFCPVPILSEM